MKKRKMVLFIAATLDGYIATLDHRLDWLFNVEGEGDNGISAFYETIDTIIMGRMTYDWIQDHSETFPYQDRSVYVFSKKQREKEGSVQFVHGDVAMFTQRLLQEEGKDIWVMGGGQLITDFLQSQLIDEIIVTIAPVLLGNGIPLFRQIDVQTPLVLKGIKRYNQFVELRYQVARQPDTDNKTQH